MIDFAGIVVMASAFLVMSALLVGVTRIEAWLAAMEESGERPQITLARLAAAAGGADSPLSLRPWPQRVHESPDRVHTTAGPDTARAPGPSRDLLGRADRAAGSDGSVHDPDDHSRDPAGPAAARRPVGTGADPCRPVPHAGPRLWISTIVDAARVRRPGAGTRDPVRPPGPDACAIDDGDRSGAQASSRPGRTAVDAIVERTG